jgi:ribonuclease P protein component
VTPDHTGCMQTFRKSERLCTFRLKELLFNKGQGFFVYPFRIIFFLIQESNLEPFFFKEEDQVNFEGTPFQLPERLVKQNPSWPHRQLPQTAYFHQPAKMMVSVPKKNFKKATDRNRIKRLVKESYRKNKSEFYTFLEGRDAKCLLAFVYTGREILPCSEIENKIIITLQKLCEEVAARDPGAAKAGE